jgi:hypothetical protein
MKKRYIYAELAGGLGNQVFIYEFAKYISSIYGGKIILNNHHIDKKHSKGKSTIEDFELPLSTSIVNFSILFTVIFIRFKRYLKIFNKFDQSLILILDESDRSLDKSMIYDLVFERDPRFILIFGFWQNFNYWSVDTMYTLKSESRYFLELQEKMSIQNPIVFHYRLGVLNKGWEQGWGALSAEFLLDCIMEFKVSATYMPKILWVFSNDLIHANTMLHNLNFNQDLKVELIEDHMLTPAELMLLISKAKFLICSNSTFSLAAARLGGIANVVIPKNLSRYDAINIFPPVHWIQVQSKWLDSPF